MAEVAWSFSVMKLFETCPRKYEAEKVKKLYPFEENDAARYGNEVHKALELYVKSGKPLGPHNQFKKVADKLLAFEGQKIAEQKQALNRQLRPTKFFAKDVWVRGLSDLTIINGTRAKVLDYKTGSAKYPDIDQLELMALFIFEHYPQVKVVDTALLFLLHNKLIPKKFYRKDRKKLWTKWAGKYRLLAAAHENNNFPPKPNGLCRNWCPVEHCEYQGDN